LAYAGRGAIDSEEFQEPAEARCFELPEFTEPLRVHVEDFDALLGEGTAADDS
jgi:hypothetical protein